jgi:hypothetical protein
MIEDGVKEIKEAIFSRDTFAGNILLPNRVFTRQEKGLYEVLASLNNKMQIPHYWGHVFCRDDQYISLVMAVNYWLNPHASEMLFAEFWQNLKEDGYWHPVSGDVFKVARDFKTACSNLSQIIREFDTDNPHADVDFRVVMAYPFPNPFKAVNN